jgi:hypothetical protein
MNMTYFTIIDIFNSRVDVLFPYEIDFFKPLQDFFLQPKMDILSLLITQYLISLQLID